MKSERQTCDSDYFCASLRRLAAGFGKHSRRGITGVVIITLMAVSAVFAFNGIMPDQSFAQVSADSDSAVPVSDSDAGYGYLFIDVDPDGVIEYEGYDPESIDLCHQSLELYPDKGNSDKSVPVRDDARRR